MTLSGSQGVGTDALSNLLQDVSQLISSGASPGTQSSAQNPSASSSSLMPSTPSQDQISSGSQNPMQALGLILEGLGELLSMLDQGQGAQNGSSPLGNGTAQDQSGTHSPTTSQSNSSNGGGFNVSTPGLSFGDN